MTADDGSFHKLSSSSPRVEKEWESGVTRRHGDMVRKAWEAAAKPRPSDRSPGLSSATLAQAARDFAPTNGTSARRKRRHHGTSMEVTGSNHAKSLGLQLELGSLGGHHGS